MTYGEALIVLRGGGRVARIGWNGRGMSLRLIRSWRSADAPESIPHDPFIAMYTATGSVVPWLCSQSDALAQDWVRVTP